MSTDLKDNAELLIDYGLISQKKLYTHRNKAGFVLDPVLLKCPLASFISPNDIEV